MQWRIGAPPTDSGFDPETGGWIRLKVPGPLLLQVLALPIALVTALLLGLGWRLLILELHVNISSRDLGSGLVGLSLPVLVVVVVIFVHELLHCLGHPGFGLTKASYIGVWPSRLMFYAAYFGGIKRNRYLLLGLLPFLVISVLPLVACLLFDSKPGLHTLVLAFASVFNGLVSCGDLLLVPITYWQVPRTATLRDQGWNVYWRIDDPAPAQPS